MKSYRNDISDINDVSFPTFYVLETPTGYQARSDSSYRASHILTEGADDEY